MCIKQGKLEWKDKLKPITNELKLKFSEILWGIPITISPQEDPLCDSPKEGAIQKEISPNLTNNIPDCGEKDTFGVSVSLVFQAFLEEKEPSLKNVFPWSVNSESLGWTCQSCSKLCFPENKVDFENDQLDIEHVFMKIEDGFYNDTEN